MFSAILRCIGCFWQRYFIRQLIVKTVLTCKFWSFVVLKESSLFYMSMESGFFPAVSLFIILSKNRCQSHTFVLSLISVFQRVREHHGFPYPDEVLSKLCTQYQHSTKLLRVFRHKKPCPVDLVNPVSSSLNTWFTCVSDCREAFVLNLLHTRLSPQNTRYKATQLFLLLIKSTLWRHLFHATNTTKYYWPLSLHARFSVCFLWSIWGPVREVCVFAQQD